VGALIAAVILNGRAVGALAQVAQILVRMHQARTSLRALDKVMKLPVERPAGRNFLHRPRIEGRIEFKGVTFSYPRQPVTALNDVSFKIEPGERVGLIGRVGSGKSTVHKLILNLYQPGEGGVLIDGTDLRQIDPVDLRRNIGSVPQETFLFGGSVRENLTMGAPFANDEAVLRAAQIAGVDEFVSLHPMGYDLEVGERGENLSGGQRQAIAVARSLLGDPPVFLLDEPTSSMDNAAENRLKQNLMSACAGKTLLLVTHRASLLSMVDRLIVLDHGKVVADGPKAAVLEALAKGKIALLGN
jgi:ATP-binding cassette subfamily C protein LapB